MNERQPESAWKVRPYGRAGLYVEVNPMSSTLRRRLTQLIGTLLEEQFPDADVVLGAGVVAVFGENLPAPQLPSTEVLLSSTRVLNSDANTRQHTIPVLYDGVDLIDAARILGLSRRELIRRHSSSPYVVELVGFLPGFAYLGPVPSELVLPRRAEPRSCVPRGSVALAGNFTGIYPFDSPGGWHLLGRARGTAPFEPTRLEPVLFRPGDRVHFEPVDLDAPAPQSRRGRVLDIRLSLQARGPRTGLHIDKAPPLATLQDVGRPGHLREGIPPSGPLDPETWARGELMVSNVGGCAAIEIVGGPLAVRAIGRVIVSIDGTPPLVLSDGEPLVVPTGSAAVRYLSVRGGFDVPAVLDSISTLVVAGLGGLGGRPLRAGDVLTIGDRDGDPFDSMLVRALEHSASMRPPRIHEDPPETRELLIDPGPHIDQFTSEALAVLTSSEFTVDKRADRVGTRLTGPTLQRVGPDLALPVPMVRGAVEVPVNGQPIVLGPDHPTTGGYPVIAVLRRNSWGSLARARPGQKVRFSWGSTSP